MAINSNYPPSGSTPITQKNRQPFQAAPNPLAPVTSNLSEDPSAAFSLNKPSEVSANPSRDNADAFDLTPFTFSVAEKLATAAQKRVLSADVMGAAMKGKTPMEYFDEVANKVQDVTTVNQKKTKDIATLEAEIAGLRPPQADATGYRAALDAFNNLAAQAPMAPTLERLNVSDTDKIMLGFALLTGANPNDAIGNFIKVKQGFVDQNNEQAMSQYKLDAGNFGNQIDAAGTRLTNERQLLNDTQSSMNQQFKTQMDALNNEADRLQKAGQFEEANVLRVTIQANTELNQYADDVRSSYTQSKSWSPAQDQAVDAWVQSHVQKYGGDPAQIKARLLSPLVGESTAKQTQAEEALKLRRLANDRTAWISGELKFANMDGRVTKADIAALVERAKKFSPENWEQLPMPKEGTDWKVIKAEANTLLGRDRLNETIRTNKVKENQGQQRINKPPATRGGGGSGGAGSGGKSTAKLESYITTIDGNLALLRGEQQSSSDLKYRRVRENKIQGLLRKRKVYTDALKQAANPVKIVDTTHLVRLNGTDTESINKALSDDLIFGGFKVGIGTASEGHSDKTKAGFPSRHKTGNAVDITQLNGKSLSTPEGKALADEFVRNLEARGYRLNTENGNDKAVLWRREGHYNHIHVSRNSKGGANAPSESEFQKEIDAIMGGGKDDAPAAKTGDMMSKMGFNTNPGTQPKLQPLPKNPPPGGKPPETPPNAGKQQPAKGVTTTKKGNKFFDEKPTN